MRALFGRLPRAATDILLAVLSVPLRVGGRPLLLSLSEAVGTLLYRLSVRRRRIALVNLDLVYGGDLTRHQKGRIARASFCHFTRVVLEFVFHEVYWPTESLLTRVEIRGEHVIREALGGGRGCLGVSGHLGNWELLGAVATRLGFDFTGVYKVTKSRVANYLMSLKRRSYGLDLLEVPPRKSVIVEGARQKVPVRSLRPDAESIWVRNRGLCYLCDQHPRGRELRLPFLGVEDTPTASGLLRYAVDRGVPLILCRAVYDGEMARWTVEGPIHTEVGPDGLDAAVERYARLINDWLSDCIREDPEQWSWGHRRFSRQHYRGL